MIVINECFTLTDVFLKRVGKYILPDSFDMDVNFLHGGKLYVILNDISF